MKTYVQLRDIYSCECYLRDGYAPVLTNYHLPPDFRKRIKSEIDIVKGGRKSQYLADYEDIFNYFKKYYGEKLDRLKIRSYGELLYRAQINLRR